MARYLVIACYDASYTNSQTGDLISRTNIEYFDATSLNRSHDERGFEVLTREISIDGFSEADFPTVPGFYNLVFRQETKAQKKGSSVLKRVSFDKSANIPRCDNDEAYLVFRAQKWNFKDEKTKRTIKGTTLTYSDPLGDDLRTMRNFVPASVLDFEEFEYVPAFYTLDTREISGKLGKAKSQVISASFVSSLKSITDSPAPVGVPA